MAIPSILTEDYNYLLPQDSIALHPLKERDASKLLVYQRGNCSTDSYKNIAAYLPAHSLMIFNNSKVIPARILYIKETGGVIEIFCLEPIVGTPYQALQAYSRSRWVCMIGGLKKWNTSKPLEWKISTEQTITVNATFIQEVENGFEIEFEWNNHEMTFAEVLRQLGQMPIPPYLLRKAETEDGERYQTVYASVEGSVAAPTAGLHFTTSLLQQLNDKHIAIHYTTLHVGAGTFKPVTSKYAHDHNMHAEWVEMDRSLIEQIVQNDDICCVGTTSLRSIESLYWFAYISQKTQHLMSYEYVLPQFIAYDAEISFSKEELLSQLLKLMELNGIEKLLFKTELMILPGYEFRIANRLITNFHQPQSTLLMLVDAFTNGEWKSIYNYALENKYRFLSYGDGCIFIRNEE